jgi:hypothetical protein
MCSQTSNGSGSSAALTADLKRGTAQHATYTSVHNSQIAASGKPSSRNISLRKSLRIPNHQEPDMESHHAIQVKQLLCSRRGWESQAGNQQLPVHSNITPFRMLDLSSPQPAVAQLLKLVYSDTPLQYC